MNIDAILNFKGRDIVSVLPHELIGMAAEIFGEKKVGSLLVMEEGQVQGIITERDVIWAIGREGASVLKAPVSKVMTRDVMTCQGSDKVDQVMQMMTKSRFRHVPVMDQGLLVGLISIGDLVQHRLAEAELEANSMRSYIATG